MLRLRRSRSCTRLRLVTCCLVSSSLFVILCRSIFQGTDSAMMILAKDELALVQIYRQIGEKTDVKSMLAGNFKKARRVPPYNDSLYINPKKANSISDGGANFQHRLKRHSNHSLKYIRLDPSKTTYTIANGQRNYTGEWILMYVHSSINHHKKRELIRDTWANSEVQKLLNIVVIFILGTSEDNETNLLIKKENDQYNDIVQANFIDSYGNLSLKAMAAINWVHLYAKHAEYILKTDDDVFINMSRLLWFLLVRFKKTFLTTDNVIICNTFLNEPPVRNKAVKWYVTEDEFNYEWYPPIFCQGSAFIMTRQTCEALYFSAFGEEFYRYDDVLLTGIIAQKAGISFYPITEEYHNYTANGRANKMFLYTTIDEEMQILWNSGLGKPYP